jgi:hypothetical protein
VIGLREGVEASLIVGIVAAFLRRRDRPDALRWMWVGVALAVVLCTGIAIGLQVLDQELPQRQQEGLETVVATVAVGMVTFMIVWMRRHARDLAGDLRTSVAGALAEGSTWGLVAMAFVSVIREGIETAVFLLAAFQASGDATAAGVGALLGILVAILVGWGIYKGGVRLNLGRFFRVPPRCSCSSPRPGGQRDPHGARGRVAQPPAAGARPELARASGLGQQLAVHRHARRPAPSHDRRDRRVADLRAADALLRPAARRLVFSRTTHRGCCQPIHDLVSRRVRMFIEAWDRDTWGDQEHVIGRSRPAAPR